MGRNLRDRLRLIRKEAQAGKTQPGGSPEAAREGEFPEAGALKGWSAGGYKTLKRSVRTELSLEVPGAFPSALGFLIPDIFSYQAFSKSGAPPLPGDLLFFDLETTGLSGGAGTVAFLAAFGRFDGPGASAKAGALLIDQYLLLDYPGEEDFLKAAAGEFKPAGGKPPLAVTFNGKSFDAQVLKTRFRMKGLAEPPYYHADLLHPARRLWKRPLGDCSQKNLESSVLGIERCGDLDGALAPDIWFSFLKTGDTGDLLGICDHNVRDLRGLASLFLALGEIAASPLESRGKFSFDFEALCLWWRKAALSREKSLLSPHGTEKGRELLRAAAEEGCPRAAYTRALDAFREGRPGEGRRLLLSLAGRPGPQAEGGLKAAAFRALAVDAEWRRKDPAAALAYAEAALAVDGLGEAAREDLLKRRERLAGKPAGSPLAFKL
ncbi:MAG: ribonuclease H-like domain-containing protein [Treponema sp.]|nr:ribonuclease H-like domain-containing protein [Treponema sp.]